MLAAIDLQPHRSRYWLNAKPDPQKHDIEHPTVSATHCELVLANDGIVVRDCASANGTFVGGERIQEARLLAGQSLHLGEVELVVETTDITIAVPKFDRPCPAARREPDEILPAVQPPVRAARR